MKISELRSLIKEEIKNTLNEETTFPIALYEISNRNNRLIFSIGNSGADLIGYEPTKQQLKKLDTIMRTVGANRIKSNARAEVSEGEIYYEGAVSVTIADLLKVVQQVRALNMTYSY